MADLLSQPTSFNLEDFIAWQKANGIMDQYGNPINQPVGGSPFTPTIPTPAVTPALPPNWKSTFPPIPRAPVTFNDPFAQPGGIYGQSPINVIGATPGGQGLLGDLFANRVSGLLGGLRR